MRFLWFLYNREFTDVIHILHFQIEDCNMIYGNPSELHLDYILSQLISKNCKIFNSLSYMHVLQYVLLYNLCYFFLDISFDFASGLLKEEKKKVNF